jgi:hypothetical protein
VISLTIKNYLKTNYLQENKILHMKNIQLIKLERYNDSTKYEKVAEGIYKALYDYKDNIVEKGQYVTAF